tara:strand:+ start:2008 stop:2556 length:549 start_codon:yes stop_codon:yes gene_type:complete
MRLIFQIIFLIAFSTIALASTKKNIIQNLKGIENVTFDFEQNINGKLENGQCIIQYPKKINCKYNLKNQKVLVSNGKSLVIKTKNSFYIYSLERTPLNFILDKQYLLKKIKKLKEREIDNKYINFFFTENDHEINLFFDKKTFNLIGWQTLDIYQNLSITYISSIIKNKQIKENLFILPSQN